MKIVIDKAIPFIKGRFPSEVETLFLPGDEISHEKVKDADALIVRTRTKCNVDLLNGSNVRLVTSATIGTDHIDINWCEHNGIIVKNAPGCNAPGVAQYVYASIFKAGFDPEKNVLGIIGFGNVGQIVNDWAHKMGIKTLICDPPRKEYGYKDVDYLQLEKLLSECDAVTLHVPFSKEGLHSTFKMIGASELKRLKEGAVLVNSSRGGVVEEKCLKPYLKERKIKYIVDVWENEPDIDPELATLATIATPHIAGYSEEGKKRATRKVLLDLEEIFNIQPNYSGLDCNPLESKKISREVIEKSYDPFTDHRNLLYDVKTFETLRNNYHYRHEPLFIDC